MTASVALIRPASRPRDVFVSDPVRALTALESAKLANWCLGRGAPLIPSYAPLITTTSTNQLVFRWRARPRYQALQRFWQFRFLAAAPMDVLIEVPDGAAAVVAPVSDTRETASSFGLLETLGAQSDVEGELTCSIKPGSSTSLTFESISCWEVPRQQLDTSNSDAGIDLSRFVVGQPLLHRFDAGVFSDVTAIGRRVSLSQWAVPATVGGATSTLYAKAITPSAFVSVYDGLPVLARKDRPADDKGTVTCKMLAWVSGGTADLRLNSSVHGASSSVSISNTSPAWSNAITLAVDCEDLTAVDGRRGGVFDRLSPQGRKNTSGTLWIAGAPIWEN